MSAKFERNRRGVRAFVRLAGCLSSSFRPQSLSLPDHHPIPVSSHIHIRKHEGKIIQTHTKHHCNNTSRRSVRSVKTSYGPARPIVRTPQDEWPRFDHSTFGSAMPSEAKGRRNESPLVKIQVATLLLDNHLAQLPAHLDSAPRFWSEAMQATCISRLSKGLTPSDWMLGSFEKVELPRFGRKGL